MRAIGKIIKKTVMGNIFTMMIEFLKGITKMTKETAKVYFMIQKR